MLVANETRGRVYLSHGVGRTSAIPTVKFAAKGERNSVLDIPEADWKGNRNLSRFVTKGILSVGPDVKVEDYPDPPGDFDTFPPVDRMHIRYIVLGSAEEFETNGLMTPMGGPKTANSKPNLEYINTRYIPLLQVAQAWLDSLFEVSGEKEYQERSKKLTKHIAYLGKLK
ncbi:MAG: hypothetical protein KDH89_11710 [Anaerolineae bacterium]|nr:hypothetical protein [Anaerolineae bacterium]